MDWHKGLGINQQKRSHLKLPCSGLTGGSQGPEEEFQDSIGLQGFDDGENQDQSSILSPTSTNPVWTPVDQPNQSNFTAGCFPPFDSNLFRATAWSSNCLPAQQLQRYSLSGFQPESATGPAAVASPHDNKQIYNSNDFSSFPHSSYAPYAPTQNVFQRFAGAVAEVVTCGAVGGASKYVTSGPSTTDEWGPDMWDPNSSSDFDWKLSDGGTGGSHGGGSGGQLTSGPEGDSSWMEEFLFGDGSRHFPPSTGGDPSQSGVGR